MTTTSYDIANKLENIQKTSVLTFLLGCVFFEGFIITKHLAFSPFIYGIFILAFVWIFGGVFYKIYSLHRPYTWDIFDKKSTGDIQFDNKKKLATYYNNTFIVMGLFPSVISIFIHLPISFGSQKIIEALFILWITLVIYKQKPSLEYSENTIPIAFNPMILVYGFIFVMGILALILISKS